ncbi:putative bromodomain, DDT domain, DNA (cytosine-5)-methyltransferase 1, replication foci [Plasmopara halstedii]
MALADIMSVEMSAKYMDSSSSSSLSSDSDDVSLSSSPANSSSSSNSEGDSDTAQNSVKKKLGSQGRASKQSNDEKKTVSTFVRGKKKLEKRTKKRSASKKIPIKTRKVEKHAPAAVLPSHPHPPPPPPPSPSAPAESSSNSSFSDSSSSGISNMSDTETPLPPPPPPPDRIDSVGAVRQPLTTRSQRQKYLTKHQVTNDTSSSLKVTLKLPPGFKTSNNDLTVLDPTNLCGNSVTSNLQVTELNEMAEKVPRVSTSILRHTQPETETRPLKKELSASRVSGIMAHDALSAFQRNEAKFATPLCSNGSPVSNKLIPSGPTVPSGEIRGARELSYVESTLASHRPEETVEINIPAHFNDPYANGGDILRQLDMFFFCDENGEAISLEVLDCPKDQRPKIMGFGTVVEHLPLAERLLPIKPILASPAFPSRSKKRQRTDPASFNPAKFSASKSRTKPKLPTKYKNKSAKADDEIIYQGDGEYEEDVHAPMSVNNLGIFELSHVYHCSRWTFQSRLTQLDGELDSDSDISNRSPDDELVHSGKSNGSYAGSGNESEILSSASCSSSGSGSEKNMGSRKSFSSDVSDTECGEKKKILSRRFPKAGTAETKHSPKRVAVFKSSAADTGQRRPSSRADTRSAGLPSDVVELMRTDHAVEVDAQGTPDELNLLECGFRHPSTYARTRVWLPEVTDWCLDYAEGDPTLWVITPHAWYKIAGPLSGLLPHPSYRHIFQHVRCLFEASYLVAYVLKEWLPINKKVSYRATLQQVIELSLLGRYRVSAWFLVKNYPFIRAQICNLFSEKDTYLESMFFRQLHRLHENYTLREARQQKEFAQREARRTKRENERLERKQRAELERQRLKDERDEERKSKREEDSKFPVDDLRLLEGEAANSNSIPLVCSRLKGVEGLLLGELIMAWQSICTFRDFLGMDVVSLEALAECITARCDEGTDVGLTRIFLAFLRVILSEKSHMSQLGDFVVEGNIKVSDLFLNSERTYGICERANGDMLNAVTWQEILRQLMSKDLGIDPSIGHVGSLVGCEIVRQTLYMQNNSSPFNDPVDTSVKGLEDYLQVVTNPMDLGTIKKRIDSGYYEQTNGAEMFANDVRLVWDNAILYNGEESEVGRAALALSDVFEQDYERFVIGRIRANQSRIEGCKKVMKLLKDPSAERMQSFQYCDVVYGLYCLEFHELPIAYKIGALSWICSEFLTLSSIRTYMASQVDQEMLIYKNYRKRASDLDSRRKQSDRLRRERDTAFRKDCASQGIHPNSHNVFSEGIKRRHEFIGKFFEDLQSEKLEDDRNFEQDKKAQTEEMANELDSLVIRESPLGKDRYHNAYYMFRHDTKPRLFIERHDSGDFIICSTKSQIITLIEWLNPKGIRELNLLTKLQNVKDKLLHGIEEGGNEDSDTKGGIAWNAKGSIELQMFPLPGGAIQSEIMTIKDTDKVIKSFSVARKMLLCLKEHLQSTNTLPASWEGAQTWSTRVEEAKSLNDQLDLLAELESAAVAASNLGVETIRSSWRRKRHEWRLALEGVCTYAQLVFLLHLLLEEFISVEAFMDLHIRLDRREWLKLRPKETHNFIPEVGQTVIYFGDGHALALKEDDKSKRKRFTQKSDKPVRNATVICSVKSVSYHHGGGDPYALAVLEPISDPAQHGCVREPGTYLCPLPSREHRLARVFLRILAKLKGLADADPFLEPVSDWEFPQYKEIILHPMDLKTITMKASNLEYKNAAEFMSDLKLMRDNCQLFCEDRFPTLPPLAHNLVYVADGQIKKWGKEIRACEDPLVNTDNFSPEKKDASKSEKFEHDKASPTELPTRSIVTILRLENRLPEYVVDASRYLWAVNRSWQCGEDFRMLFRNSQGQPGDYYGGKTAGSLPFDAYGMLPWEALRVTWDEDDGSDDNRINPWEAEFSRGNSLA